MKKVIKAENKFSEKIKYIIVDSEKKECKLIALNENLDSKSLKNEFKHKLKDFEIKILNPLSLDKEISFIWPQIINEIEGNSSIDSSINRWLEKAELKLENDILNIIFESKIALKKASTNNKFVNFLENRLNYYLNSNLEIEFHNGDFLADIDEKKLRKENKKIKRKKGKQEK